MNEETLEEKVLLNQKTISKKELEEEKKKHENDPDVQITEVGKNKFIKRLFG